MKQILDHVWFWEIGLAALLFLLWYRNSGHPLAVALGGVVGTLLARRYLRPDSAGRYRNASRLAVVLTILDALVGSPLVFRMLPDATGILAGLHAVLAWAALAEGRRRGAALTLRDLLGPRG